MEPCVEPRYYGYFFWPGKTAIHFLVKKKPLLVNTANGHILKPQTVEPFTISLRLYSHSSKILKLKMPVTCHGALT